jgi:ketosteroid isomerase-like protein
VSEENVARVRQSLEHFAATDEFLNVLAPDFVWDMSTFTGWLDTPQFHGADGLREFVTLWRAPYDDWSMQLTEIHDRGGNRVLALLEQSGSPHGSNALVHLQYGLLCTVRDEKLRRVEVYASYDAALQAAGLAG